jgi:hypothetical protein
MLRPDSKRPGVWTNDEWDPDSPGTFAVVIGVSDYAHLDGSARCYKMGKLFVSALTAFRFFEWLVSTYSWTNCPVAKCWLLLAPTDRELVKAPQLSQNAKLPDFVTCKETILDWHGVMSSLTGQAARKSRSIFFFSGHGLEMCVGQQILLPLDYMSPHCSLNDAISTSNIADGLRSVPVPHHFVFADACRSDHKDMNDFEYLTGSPILTRPRPKKTNRETVVPIFYATATGAEAFQPDEVSLGLSLFGESLLDGLTARGLQPDCATGKCVIDLARLRLFVDKRIAEIATDRYFRKVDQQVRIQGDWTNEAVTEILSPPQGPQPSFPQAPLPPGLEALPIRHNVSETVRPTSMNQTVVNDFFGNHFIATLWSHRVAVFDYKTELWLNPGADIEISAFSRKVDSSTIIFDLSIPDAKPGGKYWLEIHSGEQTVGCILLVGDSPKTLYRFKMSFAFEPFAITRIDVSLSPRNAGEIGIAARLWMAADRYLPQVVISKFDARVPIKKPDTEKFFPLATLTMASVLLRYRQWDRATARLRYVAKNVSDSSVFRAEICLRNPVDESSYPQALDHFLALTDKPLPTLAEASSYALQQAELFRADNSLTVSQRSSVEVIKARLAKAVGMVRVGGMFASFVGAADEVIPSLVDPTEHVADDVGQIAEQAVEKKSQGKTISAGA